jgi:rfaE bifunctional protein nucleotidyltransferase chain/domain
MIQKFHISQLQEMRRQLRENSQTLVWTNGCFDLLHPGHVAFLGEARTMGDALWVGVNTDQSVRDLKGPERPYYSQWDRIAMVGSLRCVDVALLFEAADASRLIQVLQPDVFCKSNDFDPVHGTQSIPLAETMAVMSYGGVIRYALHRGEFSTTQLVERIRQESQ